MAEAKTKLNKRITISVTEQDQKDFTRLCALESRSQKAQVMHMTHKRLAEIKAESSDA